MSNKYIFRLGVSAVIFNKENKILLSHRRDYDLWNLPGGGVESEESPWNGVLREIKEEIGTKAKIEDLVAVYNYKGSLKNHLLFLFICQIVSEEIKNSDESSESKYFSLDKLPLNLLPSHMERINDAYRFQKTHKTIFKDQSVFLIKDFIKTLK